LLHVSLRHLGLKPSLLRGERAFATELSIGRIRKYPKVREFVCLHPVTRIAIQTAVKRLLYRTPGHCSEINYQISLNARSCSFHSEDFE
jgi:hypothetical protein